MKLRLGLGLALVSLVSLGACFDDPIATPGDGDGDGDGTGDGDGDGDATTTGDGDPTTTGDGDPSTTGDGDPTTGDGDCEPDQGCVADAIVGWEGPLAVYVGAAGEPPPTCQGDTTVKVAELFTSLVTGETANTCRCQCGDLTGASCGAVEVQQHNNMLCSQILPNETWDAAPSVCVNLGGTQAAAYYRVGASDYAGGSCQPSLIEELVGAEHAERVIACSVAEEAASCDGGVCMSPPEAPFDGRICIATEGDVQCPNGPYSERSVYYTSLLDERVCGECECTPPAGAKCGGEVRLLGVSCPIGGTLLGAVDTESCGQASNGAQYLRYSAEPPQDAECFSDGGGIEGGVQETGAWTFCCQP